MATSWKRRVGRVTVYSRGSRSEREIPMLPAALRVIQKCVGSRSTGPVFLRRRFLTGDAIPKLAGHSLRQLEAELKRRAGANSDRSHIAGLARTLWKDAGAIRESRVRIEYMKVTRRIGLDHLTCPKDLRHRFATSLQAAGVDPMVRRDLMGHTNLEMTSHYTHTSLETAREQLGKAAFRRSPLTLL